MMNGFDRLFTIFVVGFIGWITFCILAFYLKAKFFKWLYKSKQQQVKLQHEVRKTTKLEPKSSQLPSDPYYEKARNTFNCAMKNGQLNRQDIIDLKKLLSTILGNNEKKYESYYFKNDCHSIYVFLKDGHLTAIDYDRIVDFLINRATKLEKN